MGNFYMPPEWEAHDRCWMAWPSREGLWDDIEATRAALGKIDWKDASLDAGAVIKSLK